MNKTLRTMLLGFMAVCGTTAWAQAVDDIITIDGSEYQVKGTNIIVNGSFDDGVNGWYAGAWVEAKAENYTIATEGGFDGGAYLQYSAGGVNSEKNIRGKWAVENGKMYLFRCYTSGSAPSSGNLQYSALKIYDETKDNQEGAKLYQLKWGASDVWTLNDFVFTASSDMVTFRSSWTENAKLDGFALCEVERYYSPEGYNNAMDAAKAARDNDDYANVTGEERTALVAAIEKYTNATADKYEEAINALDAATATFKAAKPDYDAFKAAQELASTIDLPYALPSKKPAVANMAPTNAADAKEKTAGIYTSLRAYYESNALAENEADAINMTDKIQNPDATDGNNGWTWTGNKNNPRNTESWTDSNGKNDYMYFDGGNWNGTGWTTTMSQKITLPAGKYILTAKGRASEGVTLTMAVGEAQVELPHVGAAGNVFDRGWNDGTVEFTDAEGNGVEILITATTAGNHEWFSVGDFRLMQLEKITVEMAGDAEKTALAQAINEKVIGKQLGFDKDEYAPYNNIEALEAAKAVADILEKMDAGTEVTKKAADEALEALNAAVWTQNTADVDIVFNGMFDTVTPDANYPLGWTRTNAWGQMQKELEGDFATAYYNQPGSMQYGNQGAYVMPLKADQWYKLTFYYHSHEDNSNNGITASVLNSEGEGLAETQFEGNGSKTEWAKGEVCFKPATAADYVLTLANNGNTWITNVTIEKTTEDDPVGIATVAATAPAEQAIYNLAGQRVAKAQKGLYIINGKKVIK